MNEVLISLVGHLGGDPELRFTPNGVAVCDMRLATTPRRKVGDEWQDKETIWFNITCWRELAQHVAESFKKGDRVLAQGKLLQQSYERNDGTTGTKLVLDAGAIGADVSRCPVELKRPVRSGSSADLMPEKWLDRETGEVMSGPPLGDAGPLVPFTDEEEAAA
ncbi:MAG TPA: single-stranded DNA-binding protein [Mycobacteriales bacterium]|nr:single-stranded DNA-binding protein [Mycobacteriales bacterium]